MALNIFSLSQVLLLLYICITYTASSIYNIAQCFFPRVCNTGISDPIFRSFSFNLVCRQIYVGRISPGIAELLLKNCNKYKMDIFDSAAGNCCLSLPLYKPFTQNFMDCSYLLCIMFTQHLVDICQCFAMYYLCIAGHTR